MLVAQGLTVTLGAEDPVLILDGISFELERGRTLGVVGESGCGKSMTALALMGLVPEPQHTGGSLRLDGRDMLGLPEEQRRQLRGKRLAMIFQEPMTALNPMMRIGAQIGEALLAHHPRTARAEVTARVIAAMHEVGLASPETRLRDYPHQFSGGQRQRILIAMALINRPRLLIADEPTTALDVTVQAQVLLLLRQLRAKHGLTMLFISHDLAVVSQIADRVAVMQHGHLVETAPVADLFRNPQHAYTRRLLASAPTMHTDRSQPLASLRG